MNLPNPSKQPKRPDSSYSISQKWLVSGFRWLLELGIRGLVLSGRFWVYYWGVSLGGLRGKKGWGWAYIVLSMTILDGFIWWGGLIKGGWVWWMDLDLTLIFFRVLFFLVWLCASNHTVEPRSLNLQLRYITSLNSNILTSINSKSPIIRRRGHKPPIPRNIHTHNLPF